MNPIGEDIRVVVESMETPPFYIYGHRNEISRRLDAMGKNVTRPQRYPLILLILDVPELTIADIVRYNLHIAILTRAVDPNLNAEDRMVDVFESILYPIYDSFIRKVVDSGLFMWPGDPTVPSHTKIDRPAWGVPGSEGNLRGYFGDPVDAVEITNLELNKDVCVEQETEVDMTEFIRGDYDVATTTAMPASGGRGPDGIPLKGDKWRAINGPGILLDANVDSGAIMEAWVDNPGQNLNNWTFY